MDRLPHAQINEFFSKSTESTPSNACRNQAALIQDILFEIIELSQEFSDLGQPNFHLLLNHFYKNFSRYISKVQIKLALPLIRVTTSEKPEGIYARCNALLPDYYSFLFRLTPF
ncbi:MAG: hypothetical protein M3Q05_09900 [Bacteroidota bacterium]|nr:hypothetical protein [Bacteroidota bacterium]